MTKQKLKRIKVSSESELRTWLVNNFGCAEDVMIVTCNKKSRDKYVGGDEVRRAILDCGWAAGASYTLVGNLVGRVASCRRP